MDSNHLHEKQENLQEVSLDADAHLLSELFASNEVSVECDMLPKIVQFSNMDKLVAEVTGTPLSKLLKETFEGDPASVLEILEGKHCPCVKKCNENDNLWLLEGCITLGDYESYIDRAYSDKKAEQNGARHSGHILYYLKTLAKIHNFDVIIEDLGPSKSNHNMSAILSCDYILPPVNPALFSCASVSGLLSGVLGIYIFVRIYRFIYVRDICLYIFILHNTH
jgi:hypothetical protein